jgi:hypothetical protein
LRVAVVRLGQRSTARPMRTTAKIATFVNLSDNEVGSGEGKGWSGATSRSS